MLFTEKNHMKSHDMQLYTKIHMIFYSYHLVYDFIWGDMCKFYMNYPSALSYHTCVIKVKPGFLEKNKLPSIFISNFHEVQQTNSCLHGTFENMGLHYQFLYDSYLRLMNNEHASIRKSQTWDVTSKLHFPQTCFIAGILYVVDKIGKEHRSPWTFRKYHMWLNFTP